VRASDRAGLVVDTLAPLGDYLRERKLVTGFGFEQTSEGVVCRLLDCRFAGTAHLVTRGDNSCGQCPVFELMQAALQKCDAHSSLCEHAVLVQDGVTCVFHLRLASKRAESGESG